MKITFTSILLTALLFINCNCQAQPTKGEYIKDDNLEKFVGTWEFELEKEKFQIVLQKEKVNLNLIDADLIIGWHIYVKDGQVIESSMDKVNSNWEASSLSGKTENTNKNKLIFQFKDINRDRISNASFELLSGKQDEARWRLTLAEKITINKRSKTLPETKIPIETDWILRKVN